MSTLQLIAEKMKNVTLSSTENVIEKIVALQGDFKNELDKSPSAKCAMELALLDMYGKMMSQPVLTVLGERITSEIFYSGVVPEGNTNDVVNGMKALGLKQVKMKASQDYQSDIDRLETVKSSLGDDIQIRIDANGAWSLEETIERIEGYHDKGIDIFEQPMPVSNKEKYPLLKEKIDDRIKIILDESVCTYDDAIWFIENDGASGFNLKISKHGGLINTLAIHRLASENGLTNQLGCHVGETSILTAAGVIFAALSKNLYAYEGAYGNFLLEHDIVRHPI